MQKSAGQCCFFWLPLPPMCWRTLWGNGFIAAFIAGMVFGNTYKHGAHFISEFMEGAGQLLTMAAFLAFGAFLCPSGSRMPAFLTWLWRCCS